MKNIKNFKKISVIFLQLSLGLMFFYAGISKVTNPNWSAEGYLLNAKTFSGFYQALAAPNLLPIVNFLNEWGLVFIGVSLLLGAAVKFGTSAGVILMFLYYFPVLNFPYVSEHSLLVDEHIIYAAALGVICKFHEQLGWSLTPWWKKIIKR